MNKPFIDSNVILYLLSSDNLKADKSEAILAAGGVISVQVLNEVVSVCRQKLKMEWAEVDLVLQAIKANVEIIPLTEASHELAMQICKRYQLSFYDAHICSAAVIANCKIVLTEDMQENMVIDNLVIKNPFH